MNVSRRAFLRRCAATLAVAGGSQFLTGCGGDAARGLRLWALDDTIPSQLVGRFRRTLERGQALDIELEGTLADLFETLEAWQEPPTPPRWRLPFREPRRPPVGDLTVLGDYWLAEAIERDLLRPVEIEALERWQDLPEAPLDWSALVRRNRAGFLTPEGSVWGLPYRWGTLAIAYRRDAVKRLGWTPTDWADLWRPELQRRISLLDSPRVTLGLTLKHLGHSFNETDLAAIADLRETLSQLHQQAKLYSSDRYLQPLLLGDTWAAVGWSSELLALPQYGSEIEAVVPASGTCLWADLWVRPAGAATDSDLWARWVDFCWQPEMAEQLSVLSSAASPLLVGGDRESLPPRLRENPLVLPPSEVLSRSEFLQPLGVETLRDYAELWQQMRTGTLLS